MQFKNTSDIALQTDTDQHNTGGELHAKVLWRRQSQAAVLVGGGPAHRTGRTAAGDQAMPQAAQEPLNGIAKGAGVSRPLARVPSLIHEGHFDTAHQRGDNVVEHGSQR